MNSFTLYLNHIRHILQHPELFGLSLNQARHPSNLMMPNVAKQKGEARHAVIGQFKGKYYVGIFTVRPEGIRIISVRRARHEEEKQAKEQGL